jgi:hypothetical protein
LTARSAIPEFQFLPIALGSQVQKGLGATDLINGHFFDVRSVRISVFAANWHSGQGDLNSVGHSPEKCWVGSGFRVIEYGGPSQMFISIGGRHIPFQCRVLEHSNLMVPEITLWAASVDGRWDGIPYQPPLQKFKQNYTMRDRFSKLIMPYKQRWDFFCECMLFRQNPAAPKQFIRLSTPITTEWQTALVELTAFANRWLESH